MCKKQTNNKIKYCLMNLLLKIQKKNEIKLSQGQYSFR